MATILQLDHLSKSFIIGQRKNAQKAQKAIERLHHKIEAETNDKKAGARARDEAKLQRAEELFAADRFEASYEALTGKALRPRQRDHGVVVHALRGVDLIINEGELVAIMGPSGSGKSTLLNMLGLLDQPTAGRIRIKDQNVTTIKRGELPAIRSHELGFVFQSFNLVTTLTALENVMLPLRYAGVGRSERKRLAAQALERVGLGDRLGHTPNELSGGQQQRVAIARSIVNNPAIIFGDELTGELDSSMTTEVMDLIVELNRAGRTFVIVTHNPEVAARCRRVIYMRDGKIEREVTPLATRKPLAKV